MSRKKIPFPREFFDYAESLVAMDDKAFSDEFVDSEDTVEFYIGSVKNGRSDLPDKDQLARACLCLIFSLPENIKPRQAWSVIHLLASPETGVSLYSIKPQISELLVLARDSVERIIQRSKSTKILDDYDDLF